MRPLAEMIRRIVPEADMHYWRPQGMKRAPVDISIYLNRSTRWVADPAELPATARPQVVIAQHPRKAAGIESPAGWLPLGKVSRDNDIFVAFLREPDVAPAPPAEASAPAGDGK